jgi:putative transposase
VPRRQPKRRRLWLADGSCLRLRPERPNHVWAYDVVEDRTHAGRKFRLLVVVDEYSRECLAIVVARRLGSADVLAVLAELFVERGPPEHIRSDNGPELTAKALRAWLERLGVGTLVIAPGSPWANGYCESFIGKLRDELLDREIFYTLREAEVLIATWRRHYNAVRPHAALGYRPPAPEAAPWPVGVPPPPARSGLGPSAMIH